VTTINATNTAPLTGAHRSHVRCTDTSSRTTMWQT
jgi:hypothetical protein